MSWERELEDFTPANMVVGSARIEGRPAAIQADDFTVHPGVHRAEIQARLDAVRSPFRTAELFGIEEIIDPRDTRPLLCAWAARAHELVATSWPPGRRRAACDPERAGALGGPPRLAHEAADRLGRNTGNAGADAP